MPQRRSRAREQFGEPKWKVLRYSRAYLKLILMILPAVAVGLSLSFDKVAYIHQTNDTAWFNLSVKFPFHHGKDTVKYTNETTPPNIEFGNDVEICSWLFMAINAFWFIMAFGIFLAYILVHGGEQMERAATVDGFVSCSASVTGATVTSLWLYNIVDLRKTVIGAIDYVYNGPSECWNENICEKSIPSFLFLYIAAGIGLLSSVLWGVNIIIALRYAFGVKNRSGDGERILPMNDHQPRTLEL